jgi:hypothetical protein
LVEEFVLPGLEGGGFAGGYGGEKLKFEKLKAERLKWTASGSGG